jgi:hypothetical protein
VDTVCMQGVRRSAGAGKKELCLTNAKSVQRVCYTDLGHLCTVRSVLYRRRLHSMLPEPQRRHSAVYYGREGVLYGRAPYN